jgi:CRP-like cAMP-binding protein
LIKFSDKLLGTLYDGSHFGEISLLIKGKKRTASVKAMEMCEIYKLSQKDFRKVVEPHPELLQRMEKIALQRIKYSS